MPGSSSLQAGETFDAERLATPAQALAAYFAVARYGPPPPESVPLERAAGRVLAVDALADAPYPADARSTMDGFAIRVGDGIAPRPIVGEVRMGHAPPHALGPGEAMRIPTGGVVPAGADAVVPVEDTEERSEAHGPVLIVRERVDAGENFTAAGEDMQAGQVVLRAGRRIGGPELAVLATLGIVRVPVFGRPRVAIVSTGDELVAASRRPGSGQVRDSNRWALAGALAALGCEPLHCPNAADSPADMRAALAAALAAADAVVLTGGSSVGVRDLTPRTIDALGTPGVVVHGIRVKPGKPTVFALLEGKPVIGLPGNPASSLMILEAVVAPVFTRLTGETPGPPASVAATADAAFRARPGWTWFVPAALRERDGRWFAAPLKVRSAHSSLLAAADGYVVVGPDVTEIAAGEPVMVRRFSGASP